MLDLAKGVSVGITSKEGQPMVGPPLRRHLQGVVVGEFTVRRRIYIVNVRKLCCVLPAALRRGIGLALL